MKIIFMGTPDLAVNILDEIIKSDYELLAVVTQPDKRKGRGKKLSPPPVKELALKHDLLVLQPEKVREGKFIDKVRDLEPDIIVVAAYGQILPKELLDIPRYGCINVHTSLLPKYRGAAPIQYAIINGDEETGVTIMYMDVSLDTGDIILQKKIEIEDDETAGSLHDKLARLGAQALIEALDDIKVGKAKRVPQDDSKASYVRTLDKKMGEIDFTQSAIQIERKIRGLNPWPSAYTFLDGKSLKIWEAQAIEGEKGQAGEIVEVRKDAIVVMTGDGLLLITELQLAGKKRMDTGAFLLGYEVKEGKILPEKEI